MLMQNSARTAIFRVAWLGALRVRVIIISAFALSFGPGYMAFSPARGDAQVSGYELVDTWPAAATRLESPYRIDAAPDGRILVLDVADETVKILDQSGAWQRTWVYTPTVPLPEPTWSEAGPFNALGLPEDGLLVLHRWHRILKDSNFELQGLARYSPTGATEWKASFHGVGGGMGGNSLSHPDRTWFGSMALSADRNLLFILDQGRPLLARVDTRTGSAVGEAEWLPPAGPINAREEFDWYVDIDTLRDGRVVLLNQARSRVLIRRMRSANQSLPRDSSFVVAGRPHRLAAGSDDSLFILDETGIVRQYSTSGTMLASFDARPASSAGAFFASDVDVRDDGSVLVLDQTSGNILVFFPMPVMTVHDTSWPRCRLEPDKSAVPGRIQLGEPVEVRLNVTGSCPDVQGTDIVLLINRGLRGGEIVDPRALGLPFADAFIRAVDLERDRVTVVSYGRGFGGRVEAPLGADRDALLAALPGIVARPVPPGIIFPPMPGGFEVAQAELSGVRGRAGAARVIIALTDGTNHYGTTVRESVQVRGAGTRILTLSTIPRRNWSTWRYFFRDEAQLFLRFHASHWDDHFEPGSYDVEDAAAMYGRVAAASPPVTPGTLAETAVITDVLPVNMEYVIDSASPPATWDPATRTIRWEVGAVTTAGLHLTIRVRPLATGIWPTNETARGAVVDAFGRAADLVFPIPRVEVIAPTATPAPTSTNTATSTRSPTSTATAFPTESTVPTPQPRALYLPLLLREECQSEQRRVHVALVLDTSTSMTGFTAGGRSKLDAARESVGSFLDRLRLTVGDQAAVVQFNSDARLLQPLTSDRSALDAALSRLSVSPQTRIDLGIHAASSELDRSLGHDVTRVIVLLTDGRANPVGPDVAEQRAAEAKASGVIVFAIGLGADVDADSLERIATRPGYFYHAPDAEDLTAIYEAIAIEVPCPGRG